MFPRVLITPVRDNAVALRGSRPSRERLGFDANRAERDDGSAVAVRRERRRLRLLFPLFPVLLLLLLSQSRVNARYRASSWDIPQFSGRSKSSSSTIFALV